MKISRNTIAPLMVAAIALVTGGWFLQQGASQGSNVYFQANLFSEVLHHVQDKFVDQKSPSDLYKMAIDGMLEELGDPHTSFMSSDEYGRLMVETQGEYGGVGMEIGSRDGWITVIAPLPGTPAERAGLQAGDRVVEIEGKSTRNMAEDDAVKLLRGPRGQAVNFKVLREGMSEPAPYRIVREEIRIKSVPAAYMIDNNVGYVELVRFSERSTDELRAAITKLKGQGMKGLVLDLRRNPGGLLDQGIGIADLFLDRGDAIAETRSRMANQNQKALAVDADEFPNLPVVVLVGPGSASASEILAGALQDHDRALVLGRTSFGKGSVQTLIPLANKNYLKMTTARWYTPSGRSIQRPYGIGANHAEEEEVADTSAAANDSTRKPAFKTDGGRTVYGGGGIHPDLLVNPDTLTLKEKAFYEAAQKQAQQYTTSAFNYAVKYVQANPSLKVDFTVSDQMLNEFYDALARAGVKIDRSTYSDARKAVAQDIGLQIAYSKWGQEGWRKRANLNSPEINVAADLLRKSPSPQSLFAAAANYEATHAAASPQKQSSNNRQR
ncbi:MAG TPA: S41 family peptidase [Longimicrobiales bacterium]|nr:S41 family peptidase [Longimicrobiales bacterium]